MQVVGYIRVSTEDQAREGVSLAAQRAKIDAYALVKDWRVVEVIQDDMTAKHLRRRGVQRLLELVAFSVNRRNFGRQRIYPLSHNDLGGLSEDERILLANSEALKFRLAYRLFEGTQALKQPLQKPRLCGVEIGSPTVSERLLTSLRRPPRGGPVARVRFAVCRLIKQPLTNTCRAWHDESV